MYLHIEANHNQKKNRIAFKLNCENCNKDQAKKIRSHICEQFKSSNVNVKLTKFSNGKNMTFSEMSNFNNLFELEQCIAYSEATFEELIEKLNETSSFVG